MPVDYTKMFRFGHISIAASGVAANSMMNIMVYYARNIYAVLTDRENMVVLNSATTTMQMTRGQYMLLLAVDKLVKEDAEALALDKRSSVTSKDKKKPIVKQQQVSAAAAAAVVPDVV